VHTESIATTVIPRLFVRPASAPATPIEDVGETRAAELARLLIAPSLAAASELIEDALAAAASPTALFAELFEPAARCLGDLWNDDECTEFEVTIGLCHLQTAMRRISFDHLPAPLVRTTPRFVLLAPQPGEPHLLCAALNSELMRQVGWSTACEFPDTDKALCDIVSNVWFDALDLSLSAALRREHWLPRMAETIRRARRASRNPGIAIVVSGRLFAEQPDAASRVGADAAVRSALQVEQMILRAALTRNVTRRPANFAWI
jgi:hypothetical protein